MKKEKWIFPAEWEKQEGVLLCFPHNGKDWPGKYGAIQWAFIEFIKKIAEFERVMVVVSSEKLRDKVHGMLSMAHVKTNRVSFIVHKTNRSWMRDSGPIIVKNGKQRKALNFNFNGWAKYPNYKLDRHVPSKVADFLNIPVEKAVYKGKPIVLEGGAIDVNGKGTLITTEECLLDPKIQVRNQRFTKEDYEKIFKEYLGVTNTIWLGEGIKGDDTHGHVDDLARFVSPNTIVTVIEENPSEINHKALRENFQRLEESVLENGERPTVIPLPMPKRIDFDGLTLPASYANFLILNHAVLVPTFNDSRDSEALNLLTNIFPDREVIGISAIDLIWGFGTLHCLSQQIPSS